MANFRGGSTKNVDLVAIVYDSAKHEGTNKAGEPYTVRWADVQVLQTEGANPNLARQEVASLYMEDSKKKPGTKDRTRDYQQSQIDAMAEASGANTRDVYSRDGEVLGKAYCFTGDVMLNKGVVDTKSLKPLPEGVDVPKDVADAQVKITQAYNAERKAEKAAEKGAEAPQAETAQAEAKAAEPELG